MSHHPEFIKILCQSIVCESYLELGLYEGETFKLICDIVPRCVGVDLINKTTLNKGVLHIMTTDEYFKNNTEKFDVIFIDADHNFNQAKIDFDNSCLFLNTGGVIVLHDTDPAYPHLLDPGYCGDSYKIIEYIRSLDCFDIVTLPISNPGLSVVVRKNDRRVLSFNTE